VRLQRNRTQSFNTWFYLGIIVLASLILMGAIAHNHNDYSTTITYIYDAPAPDCRDLEASLEREAEDFLSRSIRKRIDAAATADSSGAGELAESLHDYSASCFEQGSNAAQLGGGDPAIG
jgi:hypothetical protein